MPSGDSLRYISKEAARQILLGKRVEKATADVLTGSAVAIFTVSGGRVLVTSIIGEVTTIIAAGTTPDAKFQSNPTTGTTNDMCGNLQINDDEVGTMYGITGVPGDAMLDGKSGALRGMTNPVVVAVGAIEFICDENVTGSIKFQLHFIPLDDGADVVAA